MYDAAHAFGCSYGGKMVGSFGNCEVLSFHATKFFNTFEGGALLTNDDELAETTRLMRNFGFEKMDSVIHPGTNGKMIEIAAAMGMVNMDALEDILEANKRNYQAYQKSLNRIKGVSLLPLDETELTNYQYIVIEVEKGCPMSRDQIVQALHAENILARKYFWPGCHKMKPYSDLYPEAGRMLPNTKLVGDRVIVLPTGGTLDTVEIETVVRVIQVLLEE